MVDPIYAAVALGLFSYVRRYCESVSAKMPVSPRVRKIENEIDARIRALDIWRRPREAVLREVLQTYRDSTEVILLNHLFLSLSPENIGDTADEVGVLFARENRWRAGTLWALKWASEFCPEKARTGRSTPEELVDLLTLGATYEAFVDALKRASQGALEITVNEPSRTIICYEGRQATAVDPSIVDHQRTSVPISHHLSLTEDGDQITSRWKAGDYRRIVRGLAVYAASKENNIVLDPTYLAKLGKVGVSVPQPTLVWLERPPRPPDCHVFHDLVLPAEANFSLKWKLVALLDTPIVKVGEHYCAVSSDIKAIALIDDYMLRLAARVDERQYTIAANLREDRMIRRCKDTLERSLPPWSVDSRVIYSNPRQEADILAKRGAEGIVIELKSTLRPETPWEVYKRNEDIVAGIGQAKSLVERGIAKQGFVLTDGYRGDYLCWAEALARATPVGTLYDLEDIRDDPDGAVSVLKARVGIRSEISAQPARMPDREAALGGWKLRLVDGEAPPAST